MPEGENLLSPEEAARMGRTADSLGSADDDTAGTPEHNMSADVLEARAVAHQGEDLPLPATDGGMPGFEAVPSDPVVAAQGLGGVAAEGVTKIPVTDGSQPEISPMARNVTVDEVIPHTPGLNSSEGDSSYINPESDKIEQDEGTALDMAEAGNEQRSAAAQKRGHLQFMNEYEKAVEEARGGRFGRRHRQDRIDELSWHDPRFETEDEELSRLKWTIEGAVGHRRARALEALAEARERLEKEARLADESAERREAWAKALHENPPSEAYRQAHPNIKFAPQSLSLIESWLPEDEKIFEGWRKTADEEIEPDISKVSLGNWTVDALDLLEYEKAPESIVAEFDSRLEKLNGSRSASWGEYQELYREVRRALADQQEKNFRERTQVLDDVRNGRASDPNYQSISPEPETRGKQIRDAEPEQSHEEWLKDQQLRESN